LGWQSCWGGRWSFGLSFTRTRTRLCTRHHFRDARDPLVLRSRPVAALGNGALVGNIRVRVSNVSPIQLAIVLIIPARAFVIIVPLQVTRGEGAVRVVVKIDILVVEALLGVAGGAYGVQLGSAVLGIGIPLLGGRGTGA